MTVLDRLSTGAISLWGKVGEVDPPHLVMPLTVEPSKPRLCNDNRFLNLWIADRPFQLDHLRDIVRYTPLDSFQTICDDKSGYDHIFLKESGRKYFGFQWFINIKFRFLTFIIYFINFMCPLLVEGFDPRLDYIDTLIKLLID